MKNRTNIVWLGVTGVKIPGHVGRWHQYGMPIPVRMDGELNYLWTLCHETLSKAKCIVTDSFGHVIISCISAEVPFEEIKKRGYEII